MEHAQPCSRGRHPKNLNSVGDVPPWQLCGQFLSPARCLSGHGRLRDLGLVRLPKMLLEKGELWKLPAIVWKCWGALEPLQRGPSVRQLSFVDLIWRLLWGKITSKGPSIYVPSHSLVSPMVITLQARSLTFVAWFFYLQWQYNWYCSDNQR